MKLSGVQAASHRAFPPSLHRVLRHSTLYAFGNIASRVVAFLAIPFYARFLSPEQYGLIELVELSTQTVAVAFGLQAIGTALTRLFHDQTSAEAERDVVSTALIGTGVLSVCVTAASVAAAGAIGRAVFHTDAWTSLLQAAFVAMCFASMVEVVLVYERMRDNARFYLAYSLATLVLNLGLNILFIGALGAGVWGFVCSKLVVSIGGAAFLLWRLRRDVGWHWRRVYVPEFVRFGAPLAVSGLSYFAVHFSDRFVLASAVSLAELGRYGLAYRFALMVNALVGDSFSKSWSVSLYRHTGDAGWREQFARVFAYFSLVLSTTGVAIAVFAPELLRIMVPAGFMPPPLILPILVLAYVLRDVTPVSVICSPDLGRGATSKDPDDAEHPAIRVPFASAAQATRRGDAISRVLRIVERLLLPYHDRMSWLPHACAAAAAAMTPGTVLVSTHPPVVTHLVALVLKRRFGRPWIADFRDPLWGNPFRTSYRASLIDPIIERLVVQHADAVIANTDASAAMLVSRYPAMSEKISTIWNGYDPEDRMQPVPRDDRSRRVISHVGSLYGTRTPLPFVACLNRLVACGAIQPSAIEFRQVGQSDPDCLDLADPCYRALQALGCLHAIAHALPQDEARQEMLSADWLLLLDMNATNSGLQVPAKTFEYIQACRPILALTTPSSPTERILAVSGIAHACVYLASDPDRFDAEVLAFLRLPPTDTRPSAQFWSEFDGSRQTTILSAVIDRVYDQAAGTSAVAVL